MNRFYCEGNFYKPSSFTVRKTESRPFCAGEGGGRVVAGWSLDVPSHGLSVPCTVLTAVSHQVSLEGSLSSGAREAVGSAHRPCPGGACSCLGPSPVLP